MHRLTFLLLPVLLSSCNLLGLRKHVEEMEATGSVMVRVVPPPQGDAPTYALAWRMENGERKDSVGFQRVRPDGLAGFTLKLDETFRVGAFTDENRNGAYDVGEPLDFVKDVRPFAITDPGVKPTHYLLHLRRDHGFPPGVVVQIPRENAKLGGRMGVSVGQIASLDESRFAAETGGGGLWRPLDFLKGDSLGIYFTEAYDPARIPVIFVYGIGGSPQDWRYLMQNFDRTRYQCWFYHYPSGMRLERVARALAQGMRMLKKDHAFPRCYVVAHSMGGLVARRAIDIAVTEEGRNFIPKFVSISTPWGGHKAAESGLRHLKKPVPSWIDVAPDSGYLQALYASPLPAGTRHWMLYGSKTRNVPWLKGENDGVVLVESETDLRIQRNVIDSRKYLFGHEEILNQDSVLKKVLEVLASR